MIPIISKEAIDRIDAYFVSIKPWFPFSQDDYQKWKMIKKSVPILFDSFSNIVVTDDEFSAALGLVAVEKAGVPIEILGEMQLEHDRLSS